MKVQCRLFGFVALAQVAFSVGLLIAFPYALFEADGMANRSSKWDLFGNYAISIWICRFFEATFLGLV